MSLPDKKEDANNEVIDVSLISKSWNRTTR